MQVLPNGRAPAARYTLLSAFCWQRRGEITDGLIDLLAVVAVGPQPVQGRDHRAMGAVVGPKRQGVQNGRQHAPLVVTVGAVNQGLNPLAKGRLGGLAFLDQGRQGGLADQRKEHLTHAPVGLVEGGRSAGPRTEPAGLVGTICPVTNQSNRWRIAARHFLSAQNNMQGLTS